MEEYNLFENDEFIGTYDICRLSQKLKIYPDEIRKIWENKKGIIDEKYRIRMILNPKFEKPGEKYPMCEQMKSTCFAYRDGLCSILTRTDFNRECPFFKTKKGK